MDRVSARVKLMGDLQAAITEAMTGTLYERRRGFASDREAWTELKECVERAKQAHSNIEKLHKEMWSAVTDRNEDAFTALAQELERSAAHLAEAWAQTSALAKIAVLGDDANASIYDDEPAGGGTSGGDDAGGGPGEEAGGNEEAAEE